MHWVRQRLIPPPARILDVLAGDAPFAHILTQRGYDVLALDRNVDRLETALGTHRRLVWDVTRTPWPVEPGQFDAAIAIHALQHLMRNEPRAWRELARIIPLDGQLLVVQRHALVDGQDTARNDPLNAYSVAGFHRLAETTGWRVEAHDLCAYSSDTYWPTGAAQATVIRADLRRMPAEAA